MNSDRKTLIRIAASFPKGSSERRVLLAELQKTAGYYDLHKSTMLEALESRHYTRKPNSKELGAWKKRNNPGACPVCGSQNTIRKGVHGTARELRYGCENCGTSYELSVKIDKLDGLKLNPKLGDFNQQPVEGTMLYEIGNNKQNSDAYYAFD